MVSSQNINNFSTLPSLYNLTANSVVAVTSFNATNHSISKTGTGFIYSYKGAQSILTVSNLFTGNNDITVTLLMVLHMIVLLTVMILLQLLQYYLQKIFHKSNLFL